MLNRVGVIELHETGSGHRMHCFAGRIGHEMKVKASQRETIPCILWIIPSFIGKTEPGS
jgi:hypothetical protein